jgi:hypothetical protein
MGYRDSKSPGDLIKSADWNEFSLDYVAHSSNKEIHIPLISSQKYSEFLLSGEKWSKAYASAQISFYAGNLLEGSNIKGYSSISSAALSGAMIAASGTKYTNAYAWFTESSSKLSDSVGLTLEGLLDDFYPSNQGKLVSGAAYGSIDAHSDVDTTSSAPTTNQVLMWNGTNWVPAAYNATFTFAIASFSDGLSSPFLMGTASTTWKAIGAVSFTATYTNGPATSAHVEQLTEWTGVLVVDPVLGPETNTEVINYPAAPGDRTFTLHALKGAESDTQSHTFAFYNYIFYGVSTKASSYLESDVEGLATSTISNTKGRTVIITATTGEYILYCLPVRLGTVTFTVGGFEGGFESPETVSVTNSASFTEDYYVYRSTNSGLGSTTIVVA